MFCKKCGKENLDEAAFCAGCGGAINNKGQSTSKLVNNNLGQTASQSMNNQSQKSKQVNKTIFQINDRKKLLEVLHNQMSEWTFQLQGDTIIAKKAIMEFKLQIVNNSINVNKTKNYTGFQLPFMIIGIILVLCFLPFALAFIIPNLIYNKPNKDAVINALSIYETT